jgi:F0F1-type ATP synthase assembly protein I
MKPGDMEQMDDQWDAQHDRMWRGLIQIGVSLVLMLCAATLVGVVLGYLIWGI